jgi:transcription antitermination protein NusB
MLNRRLVRIKVFQGLFSNYNIENVNVPSIQKSIKKSILDLENHCLAMFSFAIELGHHIFLHQDPAKIKYAATEQDFRTYEVIAKNRVIKKLSENDLINKYVEKPTIDWRQETDFLFLIYKKIQEEEVFQEIISNEISEEQEIGYVRFLYEFLFKISVDFELLMEEKTIVWYDEKIPILKAVVKLLDNYTNTSEIKLPPLSLDIAEDLKFAEEFISNFFQHKEHLQEQLHGFTPKWDEDRLTKIDLILILMAMAEFKYFPFIPVKVTLNEYIELAKMYSTPKSSKFINGTLDSILKAWQSKGEILKKGRGLIG